MNTRIDRIINRAVTQEETKGITQFGDEYASGKISVVAFPCGEVVYQDGGPVWLFPNIVSALQHINRINSDDAELVYKFLRNYLAEGLENGSIEL